jgi:hypothetical protein
MVVSSISDISYNLQSQSVIFVIKQIGNRWLSWWWLSSWVNLNNCARLIFTYNRERERFRLRISGFFGSEYLMKLDEIM